VDITLADVVVYVIVLFTLKTVVEFILYIIQVMTISKKEETIKQFHSENLILRIDTVKHKDQEVYLVYDDEFNKLLTQGTVAEEIAAELKKKYKDKNVFIKTPGRDDLIVFSLVGD
jgi:hypothetical protein